MKKGKDYIQDKQVRIDLETYKVIEKFAKENGFTIKEAIKRLIIKK
jgi:hypothetical protein